LLCAVCMRLLAQPTHSWRGVACVSAGGSAMASEPNERLCSAARRGDVAGIAAALLAGADPNAFDGFGETPLHYAAGGGYVGAIAALLAAGARVNGATRDGTTPLMNAAFNGGIAAIDALLAAGADVHRANNKGYTALHRASYKGHLGVARVLVEAGAQTDVRNKHGERAIDIVRADSLAWCGCVFASPRCAAALHCADLRLGQRQGQ
jgi:hypothetical protein